MYLSVDGVRRTWIPADGRRVLTRLSYKAVIDAAAAGRFEVDDDNRGDNGIGLPSWTAKDEIEEWKKLWLDLGNLGEVRCVERPPSPKREPTAWRRYSCVGLEGIVRIRMQKVGVVCCVTSWSSCCSSPATSEIGSCLLMRSLTIFKESKTCKLNLFLAALTVETCVMSGSKWVEYLISLKAIGQNML